MVTTLKIRKRCVIPHGTVSRISTRASPFSTLFFSGKLTVSEISEVGELVTPLRNDSYGVFDECDHDQESSDGREVSVNALLVRSCLLTKQASFQVQRRPVYSRFQRLPHGVQPVFDLARLFPDLVQRTGIARGIGTSLRAKLVVQAQVVACGSSYLGHGEGLSLEG